MKPPSQTMTAVEQWRWFLQMRLGTDAAWFERSKLTRMGKHGDSVEPFEFNAHGTNSTYSYGCRCKPCTAANAVQSQRVRERRAVSRSGVRK